MRLKSTLVLLFISSCLFGQYTDQINSNRPGASIGAFSVGTRVIQFEAGTEYRSYKHKGYNNSKVSGKIGFFSLRYGFLKEQLELTYEGVYQIEKQENRLVLPSIEQKREGFLTNFLGIKYLVYDPYKREVEANVYSWKANNGFKWRDLLPAVAITLGANAVIDPETPYPYGNVFDNLFNPVFYRNLGVRTDREPFISGRATLATQHHFFGTWVFVTNVTYDRIITDFPDLSYILTLTHTINPLWSIYLETQGYNGDKYSDQILRTGAAYLLTDDIQIEATVGVNNKDTPSVFFMNAGVSYRLDFHKDMDPEEKAKNKAVRKEEKGIKKGIKKAEKASKKRDRRAKRN